MVKREAFCTERGSALVEAAITIQVFFILLFAGLALAVAGYHYVSLQYSVAEGMRWAVLGQNITIPPSTVLSRKHSIEKNLSDKAQQFGLGLGENVTAGTNNPNIVICDEDNFSCTDGDFPGQEDPGASSEWVQVTATEQIDLFLFKINVSASAIGKNEPF